MYSDISELVTIISLVSISTERVVEIAKPMLPKPNPKYATAMYSLLSLVSATIILGVNDISVSIFHSNQWLQAGVIGLACTAGSGVWSDTLKIVQGMQVKKPVN